MKAKFIIEAANHPTDPEADEVALNFYSCCLPWKSKGENMIENIFLIYEM